MTERASVNKRQYKEACERLTAVRKLLKEAHTPTIRQMLLREMAKCKVQIAEVRCTTIA